MMWGGIVLGGGSGSRMGAGKNKVLMDVCGESMLVRSAKAIRRHAEKLVIVIRPEDAAEAADSLKKAGIMDFTMVSGGDTRQESVWNGLEALADCENVLVHDGARCLVDDGTIERVKAAVMEKGSGVASVASVDTVKVADKDGKVLSTPDRATLRCVQTPQGFRTENLRAAHIYARGNGFLGTDDASLLEYMGQPVYLTEGARTNLKLTTPEDMSMAEVILGAQKKLPALTVGQGYDVHRLVEGRKLILCGVDVPHTLGLLGHSDADVALHALMDAMLGAAALGDIGKHFPDTDERYRGISSMKLLHEVVKLLAEKGMQTTSCDVTIVAQKPKLLPYIPQMRQNVAEALGLPMERVNVKATTTERLSFEGEEKGISAQAVAMVQIL